MQRHISRFTAILVAPVLATFGASNSATAGTADYQYTCQVIGQNAWAMPSGTPFSHCAGGLVYERLNGQVMRVISVNGAGATYVPNPVSIYCIVSIVGYGVAVVSLGTGTIVKVAAELAIAAVGVHGSCRA